MGNQMKMLTKPSGWFFINPIHWTDIRLAVDFFFLVLIVLTLGCSSRDANMERNLTEKLVEFKRSNLEELDLRTVFGDKWEKVCLQGPYEDQAHFEKRVGRKVNGFESSGTGSVYMFWIFYRDGTSRWARVPRMEVMGPHPNKGTPCTGLDNPYLYATVSEGTKKYYFLEKGR